MDLELVKADGTRLPCEISAAVGTQFGFDGLFLQVRRSQGTTCLYDAVDAMAVGAPVHDVMGRLAALCEHDMPGSSVTIGWCWDGDRFAHAVPDLSHLGASVTEIEPKQTPWRDAMEAGTVQGGHDLRIDHPALACAVGSSGYATCWAIPVTVRGDARWGGDEFVIVCEGTGEEEIVTLARRLIDTVSAPIGVDGREIHVGLTVGVAHANAGSDVDELLRRADDALRTAKTTGKNRWLVAH